MQNILNGAAQRLHQGGIRAFSAKASQYANTINLSVGEPDGATPPGIVEAGCRALTGGYTHYTPNQGLREARAAAAAYLSRFDVAYDPDREIILTCGGMGGIFQSLACILEPGDEVLIQDPQWVNYRAQVSFLGGIPVGVPADEKNGFLMSAADLEARLTGRSKVIFLNSPNNPTGMVMGETELQAIAELAIRRDLLVISDEVYCELCYDGKRHHSIAALPGMRERTVIVNSLSKTFSMTGWRIGFAAGPETLIRKMTVLQENTVSCPAAVSQKAAEYALRQMEQVEQMRADYQNRRNILVNGLNQIPGFRCRMPEGAFYAFPNIRAFGMDSEELCLNLLDEVQVLAVPGNCFGGCGEGYIRLTYSKSVAALQEALWRLKKFSDAHPCKSCAR